MARRAATVLPCEWRAPVPADSVSETWRPRSGPASAILTNEVSTPRPARNALQAAIETSFLEDVTGPLADAVNRITGCGDCAGHLARGKKLVRHIINTA